jgi:hypothetical protein
MTVTQFHEIPTQWQNLSSAKASQSHMISDAISVSLWHLWQMRLSAKIIPRYTFHKTIHSQFTCQKWLGFLAALHSTGSMWSVEFDGADCWSKREGCYLIADKHMAEEKRIFLRDVVNKSNFLLTAACSMYNCEKKRACPLEMVCYIISSSSILWCTKHVMSGGLLLAAMSRSCKCCNQSVFAMQLTHLSMLVTGKFTRLWRFHFSPTTPDY